MGGKAHFNCNIISSLQLQREPVRMVLCSLLIVDWFQPPSWLWSGRVICLCWCSTQHPATPFLLLPTPHLLLCDTQSFVSMTTRGEQEKNRCGGGDGSYGSSGADGGWWNDNEGWIVSVAYWLPGFLSSITWNLKTSIKCPDCSTFTEAASLVAIL